MIDQFVIYPLTVFFAFYLMNYSAGISDWLKAPPRLPGWMITVTECSFCYAFWSTLLAVLLGNLPFTSLFTVPVTVLFLDLVYKRLAHPTFTFTSST